MRPGLQNDQQELTAVGDQAAEVAEPGSSKAHADIETRDMVLATVPSIACDPPKDTVVKQVGIVEHMPGGDPQVAVEQGLAEHKG